MTSERRAHIAQLLARSRTDALVEGLPDASVVVDLDLNPIVWNGAYTMMTGLRPKRMLEEASRSKCHELVHLGICKEDCLGRRAAQSKHSLRVDEIEGTQVKVPSPLALTLVVQAIPLTDELGEVYAILEIYRDVTAEARIQSRYKTLLDAEKRRAEELERTVELRTRELSGSLAELRATQAQLIQAEKLSSLGRLVSGIAHELNNPLNFIYANLDFLDQYVAGLLHYVDRLERELGKHAPIPSTSETEYLKEDFVRVASTIREGAERSIEIVKGLRTFSHSGSAVGEPVRIGACIAAIENILHHELRRANATIVNEVPEDLPSVFANQPQVEQVLINLLTNAAHAMAPKGGRVTLGGHAMGDVVTLTVTDEGTGISEDIIGKIFDPFYTTKAVGQGTGLGLSICRSIMLSWNGSIDVNNVQDKGARFSLRFKRAS